MFIAGPCALESRRQLFEIAEAVKSAGAHNTKGWHLQATQFRSLVPGCRQHRARCGRGSTVWLRDAGDAFEMPVITEVRG